MFITKEQDYAVRTICALFHMNMMTVKEICDKEKIPVNYAYKILKKLENAELVEGIKGSKGGYVLVKKPTNISLLDVLFATTKDMYINKCLKPGFVCENNKDNRCLFQEMFNQIQSEVLHAFKEKTIAECVGCEVFSKRKQQDNGKQAANWYT